jgi:hypothetical protein
LFRADFVIRKGNGNASKRVYVRAGQPGDIHNAYYAVFLIGLRPLLDDSVTEPSRGLAIAKWGFL